MAGKEAAENRKLGTCTTLCDKSSNEDFFWVVSIREHREFYNSEKQCGLWKEPWLPSPAGVLACCNLRQNEMHLTSGSRSKEMMWVRKHFVDCKRPFRC